MIINGVWLGLFQTFTGWGFVLALIDIFAMLASNLYIIWLSNRTSVNVTEWISLRGGFSIYSGWVTAATILNVAFMLKYFGVADPNIPSFDEEQITIGVLFVALAIYNLASYVELNPLFGSVFIWVLVAIRANVVDKYTTLEKYTEYMTLFQVMSMAALWTFTATTSIYDVDTGLNMGLLYTE